jgi:NAD(P)H dehydrogenase (quinone)
MPEPYTTVSVAVAYNSGSRGYPALSGCTSVLAEAIAREAGVVEGALITLIPDVDRASHWEAMDADDAVVFGCPTYMGSGSAALKAFMEETIQPPFLEQRWKDKLAAGFTNSAGMRGDKLLTLQQLAGFAALHRMIWITLGQVPGWQTSVGSADDPNRLASFLGLIAQSNADQGPNLAPPASERAPAESLGWRISEAAHRCARGRDRLRDSGSPVPSRAPAQPREHEWEK